MHVVRVQALLLDLLGLLVALALLLLLAVVGRRALRQQLLDAVGEVQVGQAVHRLADLADAERAQPDLSLASAKKQRASMPSCEDEQTSNQHSSSNT